MGSAVHGGCTVILKKSFSASKFWPDVVKYKVTVGQYIGEIARFLLGKQSYMYSMPSAINILVLFWFWEDWAVLESTENSESILLLSRSTLTPWVQIRFT